MKTNSYLDMFKLKGKNIILTGSAGLLGNQYAETLSQAGADTMLLDFDEKKNSQLEKKIIKKYKTRARSFVIDISKKDQVISVKKKVLKEFGKIDGLVNNAAVTIKTSKQTLAKTYLPLESFPLEIWQKAIEVNLTGAFLCAQQFGSEMAKRKQGVIVNVASIYGIVGADQRIYGKNKLNSPISYAATKGAIVNLTRYLAAYWYKKNVRVNTLTPGGVYDPTYHDKGFVKKYSEKTILGRMARKNEYNGALLFLVSDASSYMTGANLIIDGGWTAW